jgi:hypothetical protein
MNKEWVNSKKEIKIQKYHDKVLAAQRGDIGGRKTRRNKKRNSFKK